MPTQFIFQPHFDKDFSTSVGRFTIDFEVHPNGYKSFTVEQQPEDKPGLHKMVYKVTYGYDNELKAITVNPVTSPNFEVNTADSIADFMKFNLNNLGFSKYGRYYTDPIPEISRHVCQLIYFNLLSILTRIEFESEVEHLINPAT